MSDNAPPPPGTPPPPPEGGWQPPLGNQPQQGAYQPQGAYPPQQVVVKQGAGYLKIGLIALPILTLFGVLAVGCLAFGADEEIGKSTGTASQDDYDLTGPECTVDETTGPVARGTIKNTSKEKLAFEITVRFTDAAGTLISEYPTFTDPVDADQTAKWAIITRESGSPPDTTCKVNKVEYRILDDQNP